MFSVSEGDKRTGIERISDHFINLFRFVPFIHDTEVRISYPLAFFQEFFRVRDIVDRVLRDPQTGVRGSDSWRFSGTVFWSYLFSMNNSGWRKSW